MKLHVNWTRVHHRIKERKLGFFRQNLLQDTKYYLSPFIIN